VPAVRRSPQAAADLKRIWRHVAREASETVADRLLDRIAAAASLLAAYPHSGVARPELQPELRSRPVGSYVIFYQPQADGIEIVRVLHGRQDVAHRFET
jgi:toxin ParE1/3/4